jgi:hypothetical protein
VVGSKSPFSEAGLVWTDQIFAFNKPGDAVGDKTFKEFA